MDYKPGDFVVGIVDFFAIILPGALLSLLFQEAADKYFFGTIVPPIRSEAVGWVAFIFASYLLGQFVSLVGATFMDWIYDHTYLAYKRRRGDPRYDMAKELQGNHAAIAGVLKWASAYVRLRNSDAAGEMDRFEATSKFFRSLVLVLLAYAVASFLASGWLAFGASVVLLVLSFWRFANQRWKFTEWAYLYFIELNIYQETTSKASN